LLIDEDNEAGSLLILDSGMVVEEGVEITEGHLCFFVMPLGEGHINLQNMVAGWTVFVQVVEQDYLHPLSPPQKLS
jgi:hypothetical protein